MSLFSDDPSLPLNPMPRVVHSERVMEDPGRIATNPLNTKLELRNMSIQTCEIAGMTDPDEHGWYYCMTHGRHHAPVCFVHATLDIPGELRFLASEEEVPDTGWAVVQDRFVYCMGKRVGQYLYVQSVNAELVEEEGVAIPTDAVVLASVVHVVLELPSGVLT